MTVQMIGRYVQYRRYLWMKILDRLELEARDLRDRYGIPAHERRRIGVGISDIAHNVNTVIIFLHDLSHKGGRRRLSVRSSDRKDPALRKMIRKLDLAPYVDPLLLHIYHKIRIDRHSRTQYGKFDTICYFFWKRTCIYDSRRFTPELLPDRCLHRFRVRLFISVIYDWQSAVFFEQYRRTNAALPCSDNDYFFIPYIHHDLLCALSYS